MGCVPFQHWMKPKSAPDAGEAAAIARPALRLSGDLSVADAEAVAQWLAQQSEGLVVLELGEADLPSGAAMAALTAVLVRALGAGQALHLDGPPQLLLHNLYRVGRYPHILLSITNERHEEAYG